MQEEANQRAIIHSFHLEKLSALHPTDVCNRTEAIYNPAQEGFVLPVYNLRYLILPKTRKIMRMGWNDQTVEEELHHFFYLMVLVYLTEAKDIQPTHTWSAERISKEGPHSFRVLIASRSRSWKVSTGKMQMLSLRQGEDWVEPKFFMGIRGFPWRCFQKSRWPISYGKGMTNFPQESEFFSIPPSNPTFPLT